MASNQNSRVELVLVAVVLLLLLLIVDNEIGGGGEEQVSSIGADYSLGLESYTKAIRHPREVALRFPENALAHYHLDFVLTLAVVDERRGMPAIAERETLVSLRLNRTQPDARNLLGVIYAQEKRPAARRHYGVSWCATFLTTGQREQIWRCSTAKARLSSARRQPSFSIPRRLPSKPSNLRANLHSNESRIRRIREPIDKMEVNSGRTSTNQGLELRFAPSDCSTVTTSYRAGSPDPRSRTTCIS